MAPSENEFDTPEEVYLLCSKFDPLLALFWSLLEMENLGSTLDLLKQNLNFTINSK